MKIAQMCKLGLMSLVLVASSLMSPLSAYATTGATVKNAPVVTNPACKPELALNVQVDPKSTLQDAKARVDFGGALPNDHKCKAGDQIIVTVPSEIALPQGKVFPLGTPDAVVATATVNGDKIIITLTDFVQKNKDIKLTGWVEVKMKVTVQPGKEIKLEWNINGEVVFTYAKIETPPVEPKETRVVTWYTHRDARDKEGTEKTGGQAHIWPQYTDISKLNLKPCQDYVTQTDTMVGTKAELDAIINDGVLATGDEDSQVTKAWVVKFHKTDCPPVEQKETRVVTWYTYHDARDKEGTEKTGGKAYSWPQYLDIKRLGLKACQYYTTQTDTMVGTKKQLDDIMQDGILTSPEEDKGITKAWVVKIHKTDCENPAPVPPVTPANPITPTTPPAPVTSKATMPTELPQTGASMNMPMWLPMVLSMAVYGVMYKFQRRAEEK